MLSVSNLVVDSSIQGGDRAIFDRVSHFVFLLRDVVLRPHIGFPLVEGGLSVAEVSLDL